jgi:hypothetical protein
MKPKPKDVRELIEGNYERMYGAVEPIMPNTPKEIVKTLARYMSVDMTLQTAASAYYNVPLEAVHLTMDLKVDYQYDLISEIDWGFAEVKGMTRKAWEKEHEDNLQYASEVIMGMLKERK